MRTIGVVTTSRADYGIYLPLLRRLQADPEIDLRLYVTGMHLSSALGNTVRQIEQDGFRIVARIDSLLASDEPAAIAKSIGLGVTGFAQAFGDSRPDLLVVLGDRFDMLPAPLAALPLKLPVAHLYGGELTQGAIDDSIRHAITKLSHLHFASTETYANRIIQLGEAPERVYTVGALSLDHLESIVLLDAAALTARFGIPLTAPPILLTYHPVTLEHEQAERQIEQVIEAIRDFSLPVVFTLPNADTGGQRIAERIRRYVASNERAYLVENFGSHAYLSMLSQAAVMVGNSSSGIIEAASFKLPVVNIGERQQGRVRGKNVIDVSSDADSIRSGIARALSPSFRQSLADLSNPYWYGGAADRIADVLKSAALNGSLTIKRFHDI